MNIPTSSLISVPSDFLAGIWSVAGNTFSSVAPLVALGIAFPVALILGKYAKNLVVGRRRGIR
jgi:hypothetical protein